LSASEILNIDRSSKRCHSLPEYPTKVASATSAYIDGKVIVCGGQDSEQVFNQCYALTSATSEWVGFFPLPEPLWDMSSSVIDGKWFITGGRNRFGRAQAKTYIYNNGLFEPGPQLPALKFGHCQITINDTHVFFAGGDYDQNEAFILNWVTGEWTMLDDLSGMDNHGACGIFNNPQEDKGK